MLNVIESEKTKEVFKGRAVSGVKYFVGEDTDLHMTSQRKLDIKPDLYQALLKSTETFRFPEYLRFYARLVIYWVQSNGAEPWSKKEKGARYFHLGKIPVAVKNAAFYHLRKTLAGVSGEYT